MLESPLDDVIKMVLRRSALFFLLGSTLFAGVDASRARSVLTVREIRVPNGGIQPEALAAAGIIHLLYYSGDPAHGDLSYVKSTDEGQTWSRPLRVNREPGSAMALGTIRGGKMALGRNGRVHVVWNGSSKTQWEAQMDPETGKRGMPFLYTHSNDSQTAFEPERNLMKRTFGLDGGGTLAADAAGNLYAAWHGKAPGAPAGDAGRQVWIARSTDDGKTFSMEEAATSDPTGACGCCGMAMHSDSKGNVYGIYRSATENVHRDIYLLTSVDFGKTFADKKLHSWDINACPMSSMAFSEGMKGVEATWETGGQVFFQNISDYKMKPIPATGATKVRKHSRLAIASNGETLLVWTEGTGWGRGGSVGWQIYTPEGEPTTGKQGTYPNLPAWSFATAVSTSEGFLIIY